MSQNNINKIREEIDMADKGIIDALAKRFSLTKKIAKFKKPDKIYNIQREKQIVSNITSYTEQANLDSVFIQNIYKQILDESKKQLKNILQK